MNYTFVGGSHCGEVYDIPDGRGYVEVLRKGSLSQREQYRKRKAWAVYEGSRRQYTVYVFTGLSERDAIEIIERKGYDRRQSFDE